MVHAVGDPYLDAGVRGYIAKTATLNAWRISGCDIDDLMQEGYLCYYRVHYKYVGKRNTGWRYLPVHQPDKAAQKHFMRLLQRSFQNRITSMSRKCSPAVEYLIGDLYNEEVMPEEAAWEQLVPPEDEINTVGQLLRGAPAEIKQLLALMIDDVVRPYRRFGKRGRTARETTNQYYCRLLQLPRGTDISGTLQSYFLIQT